VRALDTKRLSPTATRRAEDESDMPIYEYECRQCGRRFQKLIMKTQEEASLSCAGCGGRKLDRLISRVAYHVSETDRLASYDPGARQDDSFYKDSRNIGLHAKKQAQKMGVDLGSAFESKLEKLRTDPGSVIKDSE
jgi:putative FmdB family regulatory protein